MVLQCSVVVGSAGDSGTSCVYIYVYCCCITSLPGRSVAGALIPPLFISNMSPDDMLHTKLHYQDVFNKPIW
ncbi:hypothetical protein HF086_015203 [Spodoptera exigua]|uniref:Uncharacterized protein n=1 Tax=Spodoptera exigua TaxID=7107 RepID=A0A922ST47_SPOEX|nr:hypothetical protein HF086_015203 [Spodoptera exigua]